MSRWIWLFSLLLFGCRSQEKTVEREPVQEGSPETAGDGFLRIAPDMLRDLKVTTLVAETHRGAEEASMLGELCVDSNRHAEVAPPIAAQVVAIRAALNERVSRGQVLVELRSVELGRARAAHSSAEARVELARQTLDRKRALALERIAARREVEEAEAGLKAAEAELGAASAALASLGAPPEPVGEDPSRFALVSPTPEWSSRERRSWAGRRTPRSLSSRSSASRASGSWCRPSIAMRRGSKRAPPPASFFPRSPVGCSRERSIRSVSRSTRNRAPFRFV